MFFRKAINELPAEVLPELANFIEYRRFKVNPPVPLSEPATQVNSGSAFLLSIADLGASDEDDLSGFARQQLDVLGIGQALSRITFGVTYCLPPSTLPVSETAAIPA